MCRKPTAGYGPPPSCPCTLICNVYNSWLPVCAKLALVLSLLTITGLSFLLLPNILRALVDTALTMCISNLCTTACLAWLPPSSCYRSLAPNPTVGSMAPTTTLPVLYSLIINQRYMYRLLNYDLYNNPGKTIQQYHVE